MGLEEILLKRLLITAAPRGAEPDYEFLGHLDAMAKSLRAKVIVAAIDGIDSQAPLHPHLQENYTIATGDMPLTEEYGLVNFHIKSQQILPLTGLRRFTQYGKSAIIPSPKQHMQVAASSVRGRPKQLWTTGACTKPDYKDNRIGRIGELDHRIGAVLLEETSSGESYATNLTFKGRSGIFHRGRKYSSQNASDCVRTQGVVLGDIHGLQLDTLYWGKTMSMLHELRPKTIVVHDLFDGESVSHHTAGKPLYRAKTDAVSLRDDLKASYAVLDDLSHLPFRPTIYVVKSNHDEFLDRYLAEGRYGSDPHNLKLSVELAQAYLKGEDPLQKGIELVAGKPLPARIKFLRRDDEIRIGGKLVSAHGDKGPNGSRGSIAGLEYSLGEAIVGHSHTPQIFRELYVVGTLSRLDLDYNKGHPSSWLHTNAIINQDDSVQLIQLR